MLGGGSNILIIWLKFFTQFVGTVSLIKRGCLFLLKCYWSFQYRLREMDIVKRWRWKNLKETCFLWMWMLRYNVNGLMFRLLLTGLPAYLSALPACFPDLPAYLSALSCQLVRPAYLPFLHNCWPYLLTYLHVCQSACLSTYLHICLHAYLTCLSTCLICHASLPACYPCLSPLPTCQPAYLPT